MSNITSLGDGVNAVEQSAAINLAALEALAQEARPRDDSDWGTDRQTDAANAFFDAFHEAMGETDDFDDWCLKATIEESIAEALQLVRKRLARVAISIKDDGWIELRALDGGLEARPAAESTLWVRAARLS